MQGSPPSGLEAHISETCNPKKEPKQTTNKQQKTKSKHKKKHTRQNTAKRNIENWLTCTDVFLLLVQVEKHKVYS